MGHNKADHSYYKVGRSKTGKGAALCALTLAAGTVMLVHTKQTTLPWPPLLRCVVKLAVNRLPVFIRDTFVTAVFFAQNSS